MRRSLITVAALVVLAAAFLLADSPGRLASASHDGLSMDAMSIDMDPFGIPANTFNSLGSRENSARVNENDVLDADEDAVDSLIIDVTATNVPLSNAMYFFAYRLVFATPPAPGLCVTDSDPDFFIIFVLFDLSDDLPDCDGAWDSEVIQLGSSGSFGSGTLNRLTLETQPGAVPGVYTLTLDNAHHIGISGNPAPFTPHVINNAYICIDTNCDDPDGDGVTNPSDLCPDTAPGAIVDSDGCSQDVYDDDLDGVCDPGQTSIFCTGSDQCPDTSGSPVDPNGCSQSQVDRDSDGVCDAGFTSTFCIGEDACPDIPGPLENDGCPPPGPPAVGGIAGLLDASDSLPPSEGDASAAAYPWVALAAAIPVLVAGGWLTTRFVRARRRIE